MVVNIYSPMKDKIMDTSPKNHQQMLAYAKNVHPDAIVELDYDETWVIRIPTKFSQPFGVSDSWKGTPAEEAFNKVERGSSELFDWADSHGYSEEPLDIIAERYNLHVEAFKDIFEKLNVLLAEAGFPSHEEMVWPAITNENFIFYTRAKSQLVAEANERLAPAFAAIELKLHGPKKEW